MGYFIIRHCFHCYRDVMVLPTLKKYVHQALESCSDSPHTRLISIEAKFNTLHAVYLVLYSKSGLGKDHIFKGQKVFQALFSRHFKENQEVRNRSSLRQ